MPIHKTKTLHTSDLEFLIERVEAAGETVTQVERETDRWVVITKTPLQVQGVAPLDPWVTRGERVENWCDIPRDKEELAERGTMGPSVFDAEPGSEVHRVIQERQRGTTR